MSKPEPCSSTGSPVTDRVERLTAEVLAAAKARNVFPPFIANRCADEITRRGGTDREIVKRVKRSLHQVGGAYLTPPPRYDRLLRRLAGVDPGPDRDAFVRDVMASHASMRERAAHLDDYYSALFAGIADRSALEEGDTAGGITVLDLACGLNPLARSLMPADISRYVACDLYLDMLRFVADASALLGDPVETFPWDLVAGAPAERADVVLLLKTLPCLDQLDPGAGRRLLTALAADCAHLIVSYPVRSLGGVEKGMRDHYAANFRVLVDDVARTIPAELAVTPLDLPAELGYRLTFTR